MRYLTPLLFQTLFYLKIYKIKGGDGVFFLKFFILFAQTADSFLDNLKKSGKTEHESLGPKDKKTKCQGGFFFFSIFPYGGGGWKVFLIGYNVKRIGLFCFSFN